MRPSDLVRHAHRLASSPKPDEADLRRAVSAAYYALFGAFTEAGAATFGDGALPALRTMIARSFEHRSVRKVCEASQFPNGQHFQRAYSLLLPQDTDPRLYAIAGAFCRLQEARQTADYDLAAVISPTDARNDVQLAVEALDDWQAIQQTPEACVFLTALLLADRWTRRG